MCPERAIASYEQFTKKYLEHLTSGQVSDGLDKFYEDYRNRTILINWGIWIVLKAIAGDPQAEIDALIDNLKHPRLAPSRK
jgi:hypothetical protein